MKRPKLYLAVLGVFDNVEQAEFPHFHPEITQVLGIFTSEARARRVLVKHLRAKHEKRGDIRGIDWAGFFVETQDAYYPSQTGRNCQVIWSITTGDGHSRDYKKRHILSEHEWAAMLATS